MEQDYNVRKLSFGNWNDRETDETLKECWRHDHLAIAPPWQQESGYCTLCARVSMFTLAEGADPQAPDMREQIVCSECRLNSRVRAAFTLALDELKGAVRPTVYLTEQASIPFTWAQRNFAGNVIGSEFEAGRKRRRELSKYLKSLGGKGSVNFEDVTQLTFDDARIDLLLSLDVLEHVPDYERAISEFARVLKPAGILVATFPFLDVPDTLTRAKWIDGQIMHCQQPEYHGDPLGSGILCWYHFGWDILDICLRNGFRDARMVMPWNPSTAFRYGLWTLVARK